MVELGVQRSCSTSHSAETEVSPEMVTRGDRPVALLTYLELTGEVKEVHESYTLPKGICVFTKLLQLFLGS